MGFIKAILGLFLISLGLFSFLMLVSSIFASVIFSYLHIALSAILGIATLYWFISGVIFFLIGSKLYFDNEDGLSKALFGLFGVVLILLGVAIAILGVELEFIAIFGVLVLFATGFAFVGYGWNIEVLNYLGGTIEAYKGLLGE